MRGGFGGMSAPGMPQMAYGYPQQGHPMAAHPQMYAAQQQYGRGGYPPQQQPAMAYSGMPQQGKYTFPPSCPSGAKLSLNTCSAVRDLFSEMLTHSVTDRRVRRRLGPWRWLHVRRRSATGPGPATAASAAAASSTGRSSELLGELGHAAVGRNLG